MADIYVATTGNDSTGDGSSGNPYATPGKAMGTASGIGWPAKRAASSHTDSWRSGSASRSVTSTRPVSRPWARRGEREDRR